MESEPNDIEMEAPILRIAPRAEMNGWLMGPTALQVAEGVAQSAPNGIVLRGSGFAKVPSTNLREQFDCIAGLLHEPNKKIDELHKLVDELKIEAKNTRAIASHWEGVASNQAATMEAYRATIRNQQKELIALNHPDDDMGSPGESHESAGGKDVGRNISRARAILAGPYWPNSANPI